MNYRSLAPEFFIETADARFSLHRLAARIGAKLPCLYVSDSAREIAPCYGLPRVEQHHHGGFYYRSLGYSRNYSRSRQRTGSMASHLCMTSHLDCRREKTCIKKLEAQMSACSSVLELRSTIARYDGAH